MLSATRNGTTRRAASFAWLALLLVAFLLQPIAEAAAISPGDSAVVSNTGGDTIRLRSAASANSAALASFPEGTSLTILSGPIADPSGGADWYQVAVGGLTGYMSSLYIVLPQAGTSTPIATSAPSVQVTGYATIGNTNGDRIRCRTQATTNSEVITNLASGDSVALRSGSAEGWQAVICADQAGFVASQFIITGKVTAAATKTATATPTATSSSVAAAASTGTAIVSGTNGLGLRCRAAASDTGLVIGSFAEGASVPLRGTQTGDWQPVVCANQNGFVAARYLTFSAIPTSSPTPTSTATAAKSYLFVVNTNGSGARCRKQGSTAGRIVTVLAEGTKVERRGAPVDGWTPVVCASEKGWISSVYLARNASGNATATATKTVTKTATATATSTQAASSYLFKKGDTLMVANTNGAGVRMRTEASSSASVIIVISEGATVTVRSGSTGVWVAITYQGTNGYVHGDYLVLANSVGGSGTIPTSTSGVSLVNGDHAKATQSVRLRSGPSTDNSVIDTVPADAVVLITGGKQGDFYPVKWDDLSGFIHGDYLTKTTLALSKRVVAVTGNAGSGATTVTGQAIVDYAMRYLGYPYVWATHGPNSFDCSGFTSWVIKNVLGKDIGYSVLSQTAYGVPVAYGDLQPGDLIMFQNTYQFGLSHVGIYIGNNQFIHAENETTGVRISSLTSTYYSTRWWGARRIS